MMDLLRRALGYPGSPREESPNRLEERQDISATSSDSASPASTSSATSASITDASITTPASSGTALSAAASSTPPPSSGEVTVTDIISTPAFTATKTTAYKAPGVNGTDTKTGTSTYTAAEYLATANATAPGIPDNDLTLCKINGTLPDNGPFCSPLHQQNLWVGYTYGVTWNPTLFSNNSSDLIVARYENEPQDVVWNSSVIPNGRGYVNVNMDKAWLRGAPGNDSNSGQNITLYLISGAQNPVKGPVISLVINPSTLPPVLLPKISSKYGMEIGLPIGLVAALLIVLAIICGMRKHERSWGVVRSHGKDYMARRARRRGKAGKEGGIQLEDYNYPQKDAFSDEPYTGGSGNAFRDEVARQREEDDRSRSYVTSF